MIEVQGLTKYYGRIRAIQDLTFSIPRGDTVGFLGLNGAGKSTALKILAGFMLPTAGSVRIDGHDVVSNPLRVRSRIGFLPERPPLYDEMTVQEFLRYVGRLRGMSSGAVKDRIPTVMNRTGIGDHADRLVETLSLGYRKRLGIAQAIIHEPDLVILDEPWSGLDPLQRRHMRSLLRGLQGDHTVLIASHNLPEVGETCDRLLVLREGLLVADGTPDELEERLGESTSTIDAPNALEAIFLHLVQPEGTPA
jgi:ABC-2 type transport system ATP-binding protein